MKVLDKDIITALFEFVKMLSLMYERRGVNLIHTEYEYDVYDDIPTLFLESLDYCADFCSYEYDDDYCTSLYVFHDNALTEYYRLCKEYEDRTGIPEADNPHRQAADEYAEEALYHLPVGWELISGTDNLRVGCLEIYTSDESDDYFESELIHAILDIIDFFRNQVPVLKEETEMLQAPVLSVGKEAA